MVGRTSVQEIPKRVYIKKANLLYATEKSKSTIYKKCGIVVQ